MLIIFAVSDSIGETAEQVAIATKSQFKKEIDIKRIPYVKSINEVDEFMDSINFIDKVIIISTVVNEGVREYLTKVCLEKGIKIINVLEFTIKSIAETFDIYPNYNPGAMWQIDADYHKRIEAIEFAIQHDDSKDYGGIKNADVILLGLSRTSKTPLCMYLANKGIKAINIPLIPEVEIPKELFEVDKRKIFALTIDPIQLIKIRKHRLDKFNRISTNIEYASDSRIMEEFQFAEKVIKKVGCKIIDVTERAIEDTALIIVKNLKVNKIL